MRTKTPAKRGYGGATELSEPPGMNVNENRTLGEIGLWIEATRGNNDGIFRA
jgi:hypothetical protein